MARVLLGVTGSVAAIQTPALWKALSNRGHEVKVVATSAALYFFDPAALDGKAGKRNRDVLVLDEDEWPGRHDKRQWQRGEPVLHIELRRWADVLVIAPLDANTLAKFAAGLCDNCLTCVWRAWDLTRPVVLAPAMNTLMWDNPATGRHFAQIAADFGVKMAVDSSLSGSLDWINSHGKSLHVVSPISKRLACDDVGMGAMAEVDEIVGMVARVLSIK